LFAIVLTLSFMTSCECLKMLLFSFSRLVMYMVLLCFKGLFQCLNKRSFSYKSTEKHKSMRSNKQGNLLETLSCRNSLKFNQAENSAKREFRKRELETKNKNKCFADPFVQSRRHLLFVLKMALIMLRYIVYILTFFNNQFYFIQLIYSFAATSTCKIGTKDCYWKKYLLSLLCSLAK